MMIVLILISILCMMLWAGFNSEELATVSIIALLVKIGVLVYFISCIVNGRVIDQKIELLENKNIEIENKVETSVKSYMEYEGNTLKDFKVDSYIQLVNLYPDLKSDELIKSEIELYQENIKEVNKLKMEKINISNYKWWVYFGK